MSAVDHQHPLGGFKHALILVDCCTWCTWICGMSGTSGMDVQEALWKFFCDAGGFPRKIQCDFDPRFLGGAAKAPLQAHGCCVNAAPLHCQSQNGLVEKKWQTLTTMARTCLTDAKSPTKFWCWAIWEAAVRSDLLPISSDETNPTNPEALTTPFEAFHGQKPDH